MRTANIAAPARRHTEGSQIDQLIAVLDQQRIGEGAQSWTAHVLGVHVDGRECWVQVARADNEADCVVLRLSEWATPQHALAALTRVDPQDGSFPHVIEVMRLV